MAKSVRAADRLRRSIAEARRMIIPPGEILDEEFLKPRGLNANRLALAMRVPANRITAIIKGKRAITAETALRLAAALGTTAEFWMNLQSNHDLLKARAAHGEEIARSVLPVNP